MALNRTLGLPMLTFYGTVVVIVVYGPRGHGDPIFMYLHGAWTVVIGGFLTVIVYIVGRLKNEFENMLEKNKMDTISNA